MIATTGLGMLLLQTRRQPEASLHLTSGERPMLLDISLAQQEGTRVSLGAAIYRSAVMEYISAEVLDLSGNKAVESNSANEPMTTADNVEAGIQGDEELNQVLCAPEWRLEPCKDGSAGDRSQLEEVGLLDPTSQQNQVCLPRRPVLAAAAQPPACFQLLGRQ
jgi:hypothetical protein